MSQTKKDYLSRLFERKKLKEKSISKKLNTPFDRKLYRTCWPVELNKISRIKSKPKERKKGKPNHKSLNEKRIPTSLFNSNSKLVKTNLERSSDSEDEIIEEIMKNFNPSHFIYESITPQMLMDILQDPEHLKSGATLDTIIAKLRALKLDLIPTREILEEEVLEKLRCVITLGWVVEKNGYYSIVQEFKVKKLARKNLDAFWNLWYKKFLKLT